jgi:hypothetical protein
LYRFRPASRRENVEQIHERLEGFGVLYFASVVRQNSLDELHDLADCEGIDVVIVTFACARSARRHYHRATRIKLDHFIQQFW